METFPTETVPLKDLDGLLKWKRGVDPVNISRVSLRKRVVSQHKPLVISCHDFKGGYVEDRLSNLGAPEHHVYNFQYWDLVDIFIYFSHTFITIPPPGWTETCHENGVRILGTMITEWAAGRELMKKFLQYEDRNFLVSQMVEISNYYGFDGWFVNIENTVEDVPSLLDFLTRLNTALRNEGKTLLWYDSVIKTGQLKWQDSLNVNNYEFFKCCDLGIFLNYTYNLGKIEKTHEFITELHSDEERVDVKKKLIESVKRRVFFGIDCFGRNTFEGGKFNLDKAIKVHQKFGFQIAIFAPGWTLEQSDGSREDFEKREKKFWEEKVMPFCEPRTIDIFSKPITSYFSTGRGMKFFHAGKCVSEKAWSNLRVQSVFPVVLQRSKAIKVDYTDAYHMGNCIEILCPGDLTLIKALQKMEVTKNVIKVELISKQKTKKLPEILVSVGSNGAERRFSHSKVSPLNEGWVKIEYLLNFSGEESRTIDMKELRMKVFEEGQKLGGLKIHLEENGEEEEEGEEGKEMVEEAEIMKYVVEEGNLYLHWKEVEVEGLYFVFRRKDDFFLGATRSTCCMLKSVRELGIVDTQKDIKMVFIK